MNKIKGMGVGPWMFLGLIFVAIIVIGGVGYMVTRMGITPTVDDGIPSVTRCDLPSAPSVTLSNLDIWGGAALTTFNVYRKLDNGEPITDWADLAGTGSFTANPGQTIEIASGVNTSTTAANLQNLTFGQYLTWTVPCESYPYLRMDAIDDVGDGNSLTSNLFDPDDGNKIALSDNMSLSAGDIKTVKWVIQGTFEQSYGNPWCWDTMGKGNVVVVDWATSAFDDITLQDANGNTFPSAPVPVIYTIYNSSFTSRAFEVPPIEHNTELTWYLVVDVDDSISPGTATRGPHVFMYDVNYYINTDVTPSVIECGIEDEDSANIAATSHLNQTMYVS